MRIENLAQAVARIADCPRPVWNGQVCADLAREGVDSILVVDDDVTPWPSGQGSMWCYVRPFADPARPTGGELQRITDFVNYETSHDRMVGVWVGYSETARQVERAALAESPAPRERPASDDPCCCRPYHAGCLGALVCHATPVGLVRQVFEAGCLLSRPAATGMPLKTITEEMREQGQRDPSDYFDFICFANGNCIAPDIVVSQRRAGRWLDAEECDRDFYPGARLFFDPKRLARHPGAAWDGIQAVKIRERLSLRDYLVAAVVPQVGRDGRPLDCQVPEDLRDRVIVLDHRTACGLAAWSNAAWAAARDRAHR